MPSMSVVSRAFSSTALLIPSSPGPPSREAIRSVRAGTSWVVRWPVSGAKRQYGWGSPRVPSSAGAASGAMSREAFQYTSGGLVPGATSSPGARRRGSADQ
ncbi:hypothetical protein RKD22_002884 [Streptomyces pristinaespiralis]